MRWRPLIWLSGLLVLTVLLRLTVHRAPNQGGSWPIERPAAQFQRLPACDVVRHGSSSSADSASHFRHRLSNTDETLAQLVRSDRAVLLENALIDTEQPLVLAIPTMLRAHEEPGSYIVQAHLPIGQAFRTLLESTGAAIAAYIPNNAYLVRASARAAQDLAARPEVQAVLPYEPYYKLKLSLLDLVLQEAQATGSGADETTDGTEQGAEVRMQKSTLSQAPSRAVLLNVVVFAQDREATLAALTGLGLDIRAEETSPFGPWLKVRTSLEQVPALARLPGVQELELSRARAPANDLSRVTVGVAVDSVTASNYLRLTGSNIVVNINDTGVDAAHPDLSGRVFFDVPTSGVDSNGHGTHVAGIIAGSGGRSMTVSNAPGSTLPPAGYQFRGKAPGAILFSMEASSDTGPLNGDAYLQQTAALTNAMISNNSWHYSNDSEYDLAAASYDAAVRDALPGMPGSQPVLYVFAAGNAGGGNDNGTGGSPDTIQSPGTAKNVITVGAVEQLRHITNTTWTCTTNGGPTTCETNTPWLAMTDSTNQVAGFSSRGNVGVGTEGDFGRVKPDVVAPGTFILSTRSGQWDENAYYSDTNNAFSPSPDANYFDVLSNLNQSVGPFYRFESGSSLAAADVSGTLALMEEFFAVRVSRTNSPALMKALLINGARSLGGMYDLHPASVTNFQGWGVVRLPNSAPPALTNTSATAYPMVFLDQDPSNALATGQFQARNVSLSPAARNQPLRCTLAWTDPPASPLAGLKLVNDLDLLVTNLDTGDVFLGNDIPSGAQFNLPWQTGRAPNVDCVNNVENVYLASPLGSHYSVTVAARRVNVNAVTANTNAIVQDYALVISSGDGQVADALTVTNAPAVATPATLVTSVTNAFSASSADWGSVLLHQRVGANSPLPDTNSMPLPGLANAVLTVGSLSQWHFYVVTNETSFTNAAFLTFLPSTLSLPRAGVTTTNGVTSATRIEADIDLYVSRNPALTNLDLTALAGADFSVGRGGTEAIVYSNATPGVYYLGIKSESQEAAEYGLVVDFSDLPFAQDDGSGNEVLRGFPAPDPLPAGTPAIPGLADLFCLDLSPLTVRRVVVTNTLTHPNLAELATTLTHNDTSVVLNRYSLSGPAVQESLIYDDSGDRDIPGAQTSQGPGSLRLFGGGPGLGQWHFRIADTNQPGTNDSLTLFLEHQPDLTMGVSATILPGACREDFLYVPPEASNVTASVSLMAGQGPLSLQLCPVGTPAAACLTLVIAGAGANATLATDDSSHPPLNAGLYVLRVCNLGTAPVMVGNVAALIVNPNPPSPMILTAPGPVPILDDAVTSSSIIVTNRDAVGAATVGVRIDHPRVSDLALHLVSPAGTRVLLEENRGGATTNGLGGELLTTNSTSVPFTGGPQAVTNVFDTGQTAGTLTINYDFYALPDEMHVYYEGQLIWDSGLISYSNVTNIQYGPGASTLITIIMNEGGNTNSNTSWFYKLTSTRLAPVFLTFCESTNLASTPIKFAPAPFTNVNYFGTLSAPSNGIFYFPEESLDKVAGESAFGPWTLEISDTRAGATNPPPLLLSWQLGLLLHSSMPIPLSLAPSVATTNVLGAGQVQWFTVDVPWCASFASNTLLTASAPVDLWYNPTTPPTGTNTADLLLLPASTAGSRLLQTNGAPPLVPGARYYLGVRNTNAVAVTFALRVDFNLANVVTLQSGVPYFNTSTASLGAVDYYLYVVTNGVRAQFEINGPTADLTLVVRKGLPFPTLARYDYVSANPGTNDELIVVYDYSRPVPLSPGNWLLGAVNVTGLPASYSIMATEYPVYGTNIMVSEATATADTFCFSWSSLPGVHYYVQGKASLPDTNWTTVSPTITANDVLTTYCVTLPSPFHFFRVHEGVVVTPGPLVISSVSASTGNSVLRWTAPSDTQFNVQWTPSLNPASWKAFTNVVKSTNSVFSFLDDGSQSGGMQQARYYRLRQLP